MGPTQALQSAQLRPKLPKVPPKEDLHFGSSQCFLSDFAFSRFLRSAHLLRQVRCGGATTCTKTKKKKKKKTKRDKTLWRSHRERFLPFRSPLSTVQLPWRRTR